MSVCALSINAPFVTGPRICCERGCSNPARADRRRCHRCHQQRWRDAHPIESAFANLKMHAKERGKPFTLTLPEFRAFCEKTDYHKRVGNTPRALTVDRIDPRDGYAAGNIRPLTHQKNSLRRDTFTEAEIAAARASWAPIEGPVEL